MSKIEHIVLNGVSYDIGSTGSGVTESIKAALLQLAEKVAYIDENGQNYYNALQTALYPPIDIASITAVYTQSGTVYNTDSLNSLKSDLVVTANYTGGTSEVIPASAYALSGTLAEGTSTITVTYAGLTDTFDVIVSVSALYSLPVIENKAVSGNIQLSSLNGNHIDLTISANSRSCIIYASGNTGDQQNSNVTSPVFFTIPAGASFTAKVKNISYSGNTEANNNFTVEFKKSDKTSIGSTGNIYIPVTGDGTLADFEVSGTLDTTEEVSPPAFMIFVYRGVTLHFDYELYFNGTRYI